MANIMDPILLVYSLFWDIGPLFWALLEVQVYINFWGPGNRKPCKVLKRNGGGDISTTFSKRALYTDASTPRSVKEQQALVSLMFFKYPNCFMKFGAYSKNMAQLDRWFKCGQEDLLHSLAVTWLKLSASLQAACHGERGREGVRVRGRGIEGQRGRIKMIQSKWNPKPQALNAKQERTTESTAKETNTATRASPSKFCTQVPPQQVPGSVNSRCRSMSTSIRGNFQYWKGV